MSKYSENYTGVIKDLEMLKRQVIYTKSYMTRRKLREVDGILREVRAMRKSLEKKSAST